MQKHARRGNGLLDTMPCFAQYSAPFLLPRALHHSYFLLKIVSDTARAVHIVHYAGLRWPLLQRAGRCSASATAEPSAAQRPA